jgi:SAM-dependent methyltransferase
MSQIRFDASAIPKSVRRNQSPYWGEHTARYLFAAPFVTGRNILDIACGTGYGLAELQRNSRYVVGADLDFEAVDKARTELDPRGTSLVLVADGCDLPFNDGSFEAITSFETLEHLENRNEFLRELRRVLAPTGICIISTPNAIFTQPMNGKPRNPHHVYEYSPTELTAELSNHFDKVELFGQHLSPRFAIPPFWDDQQRLPRDLKTQSGLLLWRIINKLPIKMRDTLSSSFWGHSFYPTESDYQFDRSNVECSRVLVALCHPTANAV